MDTNHKDKHQNSSFRQKEKYNSKYGISSKMRGQRTALIIILKSGMNDKWWLHKCRKKQNLKHVHHGVYEPTECLLAGW